MFMFPVIRPIYVDVLPKASLDFRDQFPILQDYSEYIPTTHLIRFRFG